MKSNCTALIVLNYNNFEDTINCVKSVEENNKSIIKYIVVDNGSTNLKSVEYLNHFFSVRFKNRYKMFNYEKDPVPSVLPYVSYLVSTSNDGYAKGNKKGLKYAYSDSEITDIMILNNDILFVEDIIGTLISERQKLKNAAILSPILYKKNLIELDYNCARLCPNNWDIIIPYLLWYKDFMHCISQRKKGNFILKKNTKLDKPIEIELPSGSCMLIEKNLMIEIDDFDPNTFLYYEENILYKKLNKKLLKNYIIPKLRCIHLGASSTEKSKSYFVLNAGINSASYYLNNYADMSVLQSFVWSFAYRFFKIKILLIRLFK